MAANSNHSTKKEKNVVKSSTLVIKNAGEAKKTKKRNSRGHRRCSIWQLITWAVLTVLLVVIAAVAFMNHSVPIRYKEGLLIGALLIVILSFFYSFRKYHKAGRFTVIAVNILLILINITAVLSVYVALQEVKIAKPQAVQLKNDLGAVIENIKKEDTVSASASLAAVNTDNADLKETMSHPIWKVARKIPKIGAQVRSVDTITDVIDQASGQVISPLINLMNTQPLSQLKVGDDGFNVTLINSYLDFADQVKPVLSKMNDQIQGLDLSMTGEQDAIDEYKQKYTTVMNTADKYMPLFRIILGNGSDRNYLFVAQNLAEGRTNGGFPGSASIMRVSNGVLTIGDFQSIYDLIPDHTVPADVAQTEEEMNLFDNKMYNNWDANYSPDFARAGQIWSRSYEDQNGESVNGVISMTPSVIQDALKIFNTSITLSDGTVMDGTNAARIMAYDLYYKYLGTYSGYATSTGNEISDELFSETVSKSEDILISNFFFGNIKKYAELLGKAMNDRTLLIWMADGNEEQKAIDAGVSGILTDGRTQNGDTGFYWSFDSACKMGWFMDLQSSVGQAAVNQDGTYTYPVTVTMKNTITSDDIANGSNYILGEYAGRLQGQMHIFAPLGGKITDVSVDDGTPLYEATYEGLQNFYNNETLVYPGRTMTVTYKVTLPAGVKEINLKVTPNYNNYR